jgi:hypothetical protein
MIAASLPGGGPGRPRLFVRFRHSPRRRIPRAPGVESLNAAAVGFILPAVIADQGDRAAGHITIDAR